MVQLILIRHGQSQANALNQYTGWSDVPLTAQGKEQARLAGQKLYQAGVGFEAVHTSVLQRAIQTAMIIQNVCHAAAVPLTKSWRLNERHYGALRGRNKDQTRQQYGAKQVALWRRSYAVVPPPLTQRDTHLRVYRRYPQTILPWSESLKMALQRTVPYFQDHVGPALITGHNQLIVAHGSTLRALIKYLEAIDDQQINHVEVANGQPIIYEMDQHLQIRSKTVLT